MTKLLKILGNIVLFLVEIVLICIIVFAFLIRTSNFQTYLAHKGAEFLTEKLDTKVSIGRVDVAFIDQVYFDQLYIEDQQQDTLFYINEFRVNYNLSGAMLLNFNIEKVRLKKAKIALRRRKDAEDLNLQFIIDAFKPEDAKDEPLDFAFNIKKVELINSHFIFDDENAQYVNHGVDFKHIDAKHINLTAYDVLIYPDKYIADIQEFNFQEKSGFELTGLTTRALFGPKGLRMAETELKTRRSHLKVNSFALKTRDLSSFSHFVDSVGLESDFKTSEVALNEVALFAPQLKGMNEVVTLAGNSKNAVNDLLLNDISIAFGKGTKIKGDFSLPNFTQLSRANIKQQLDYLSVNVSDIKQFRLPDSAPQKYISWPEVLDELRFFEINDIAVDGNVNDLNFDIEDLNTNLGSFQFQDAFRVLSDTNYQTFTILPKNNNQSQVQVSALSLSAIVKDKNYGKLNGLFGLNTAIITSDKIQIKGVEGTLTNTELYDYSYDYIILDGFDYTLNNNLVTTQNSIQGKMYVRDENFDLSFDGLFSMGNDLKIKADIDLECARLDQLNSAFENMGELSSFIKIDAAGSDFNDFKGDLFIDSLYYEEDTASFSTTNFNGFVERRTDKDSIAIQSDFVAVDINGLIDYSKVGRNIRAQIGQLFPAMNVGIEEMVSDDHSKFDYDIKIKRINPILNVLYPVVQVADQTFINGYYNGNTNALGVNLSSDYVAYDNIRLSQIDAMQEISNQELLALIDVNKMYLNDSLTVQNIHFTGLAADGGLDSQLLFEDQSESSSNVEWFTNLQEKSAFEIKVFPSYITLNGHQWNLKNHAELSYIDECLIVEGLKLEHEDQYVSANGHLSSSMYDKMYLDVMDLDLKELGDILGPDNVLSGTMNVSGYVTTPVSNLQFFGEAIIDEFKINETKVGNLSFGADYTSNNEKVNLFGDILYGSKQTFQFKGDYYLSERSQALGNLDFTMIFNKTDISVVNEFLDPDVISDLRGNLNGELKLIGTFKEPVMTGKVDFNDGMINLAILGSNMFFEGEIESVKDGVYINQMPVKDVEGNTGFLTGSLFHDNFSNFYFELIANLEEHPVKRLATDPSKPFPVDRFKVMNTSYDIENPYYGEAYITGIANISGYADNLSIIVNAKTKRGTKIVFPMYGPTTITEDGFISFKKDSSMVAESEKRVDLTGVDLQLNFDVTDEAQVKLIFDEKVGDEISARGKGDLSLTVDQFNDLAMDGTYRVSDGVYNFVLGPYKQNFNISPGGTVQWAGDPYEAILNIDAYYRTMANLSVVMPDVVNSQSSNNEEIFSHLNITGNMMSPEIAFDLEAPKASESGKAIISRIRSDQDELNKQFFSILISKSFIPLSGQGGGSGAAGGGAFLDLATTQINNILNKMTEGYQMNVNLENDEFSGQFSGEFGVSKAFLDDRLLVSGSFGVGTTRGENGTSDELPSQNQFIGDVKVEYLLNEQGTFRMNVFNESNNTTVLQNEAKGQFTQGLGVSYKEDFHTLEDFKLFQFFANIFRKRDEWVDVQEQKNNKVPIPAEYRDGKAIKNEE
ncbi:hypothetical protein CW751_03635 [Brumimicrobium salinarum]|uniref:Translocation and assembly module TamB C-terminal domain-containing protein n=1 Tax=Brumimicrobium salinarum TaxID=2058658 RepID=A0A2I0R4X5_9FLAO|nr:translocation/assembly module TamB domain-containing protein [Brumimicrobium salinarum]PKR81627.1 hypothetical protein CW751_03635 [Brumimicrobium salinarum]